ncbi:MAG: tRNA (N(6)-L-threonylcarbamoyladenosine(37)-C(2))-methylthiotransferase MtaB [Nitrospirota bacterium]
MKIAFATLGCKVNQYDTAIMEEEAKSISCEIVPFDEEAEIYVINTCTVTGRSDYQSRQLVRRAFNKNRGCKIVVTGCYAETGIEELSRMDGVEAIIGNAGKNNIKRYLEGLKEQKEKSIYVGDKGDKGPIKQPMIKGFDGRTRAFLKVQDGCDSGCSYCIIPKVRGKSRSLLPDKVIEQARLFEQAGFKEIVIAGIHLGYYGKDLLPKIDLSDLLTRIVEKTSIPRIRISSIDPNEVDERLLSLILSSDRICRHLHIPIQSGDDMTLKRMKRGYSSSYYRDLIIHIKERIPDIGIGTDVIVGFPGEDEEAFENSFRLLGSIPVDFFHVFSFSPRAGTEAASAPGRVTKVVIKQRNLVMRDLGRKKGQQFRSKFVGRRLTLLIEDERDQPTGLLKGYSDNYLKILIEGEDSLKGHLVIVRINGIKADNLIGSPVSPLNGLTKIASFDTMTKVLERCRIPGGAFPI